MICHILHRPLWWFLQAFLRSVSLSPIQMVLLLVSAARLILLKAKALHLTSVQIELWAQVTSFHPILNRNATVYGRCNLELIRTRTTVSIVLKMHGVYNADLIRGHQIGTNATSCIPMRKVAFSVLKLRQNLVAAEVVILFQDRFGWGKTALMLLVVRHTTFD